MRLARAAVAACAVLAVALGVLALTSGGGSAPLKLPRTLPATIAATERFDASVRGFGYRRRVRVLVLSGASFVRRMLRAYAASAGVVRVTGELLQALGLLPPGLTLAHAQGPAVAGLAVGLYNWREHYLALGVSWDSAYGRIVLAHELTHALDDQRFDLDRPALLEDTTGAGFAFTALAEGDARYLEERFLGALGASVQRAALRQEQRIVARAEPLLARVPAPVQELFAAPYELGLGFVEALVAHGGEAAVDRAFRAPPVSTQQILFPAMYLAGMRPLAVAPPAAGGRVDGRGVFGAYLLYVLLGGPSSSLARAAAQAWGGDRYVTWHRAGSECVAAAFTSRTPAGTSPVLAGLRGWAASRPAGTASASLAGGRALLRACSG